MLKAGIVGLGQVGMLFDEDDRRRGVWTHFTAYERLSKEFNLVAVCEPDPAKARKAVRRRNVRVYQNLSHMLKMEALDVLSLCTPPALHTAQILQSAGRVRAVICEKPLGENITACRKADQACQLRGTLLAVNYYKRYEGAVRWIKEMLLKKNNLGSLRAIQGYYSGPLGAVGSHMIDLFSYLSGSLTFRESSRHSGSEEAYSASFTTNKKVRINLIHTGEREKLVFEMDLIGTEGRCRLLENCQRVEWSQFRPSKRYGGYSELVHCRVPAYRSPERFLPLFQEVASSLKKRKNVLTSTGRSALESQMLLNAVYAGARS